MPRRAWKPGDKITPDVIRECMDIMVKVISLPDGEKFVPMYQRLERELAAMEEHDSALARIKARAKELKQENSALSRSVRAADDRQTEARSV